MSTNGNAPGSFSIYKRYLPHWRADDVIYFVTWRLHKSNAPLRPEERTVVASALEYFHGFRYSLLAYVVMDDHVHVLVRMMPGLPLEKVLQSWKSYTANHFQRNFDRERSVWEQEYRDHIIRGEEELIKVVQYISDNPLIRWPDATSYQWVRVYDF